MPTQEELAREAGWFDDVLRQGPRHTLPVAAGKLCQACGEIGVVCDIDEDTAAHCEIADFLAFSTGHRWCHGRYREVSYARRRYCEVCRAELVAGPGARVGLLWVCRGCRERIDRGGREPAAVLGDLALRRFAGHVLLELADADEPARDLPSTKGGERLPLPPDWLPRGLYICGDCGMPAGETKRIRGSWSIDDEQSLCLCHGLVCRDCRRKCIRRPVSNYFEAGHGWWHVPWFATMGHRCDECRAAHKKRGTSGELSPEGYSG